MGLKGNLNNSVYTRKLSYHQTIKLATGTVITPREQGIVVDVLSIKRFVSSKSFLTLHINRFLSTFTKYLAAITLILRGRRGEYSYNLLPRESSSCKKQLNTTHNMLPKTQEETYTKN